MVNKNDREYSNGEITVFWKPDTCIHATICFMKLRKVFDPTKRPWVNMQGASSQEIIAIVEQCPTDALTWKWNRDLSPAEKEDLENPVGDELVPKPSTEIIIMENGAALIKGSFIMKKPSGEIIETSQQIALCRCGYSRNKPFCDGSHYDKKFKG
jgi:uncharacterized Fe-S cluster protein YjdI